MHLDGFGKSYLRQQKFSPEHGAKALFRQGLSPTWLQSLPIWQQPGTPKTIVQVYLNSNRRDGDNASEEG